MAGKKKKRKKKNADEPKSYKRSTPLEDKKPHESNGGCVLMLAQAGIRATLVNRQQAKNDKSSIDLLTGKGISTGRERDLSDTNKTGHYKHCAIANTCTFPPLLRGTALLSSIIQVAHVF